MGLGLGLGCRVRVGDRVRIRVSVGVRAGPMAPPVAQHLRSISGVHRAASGSTSLVRVRG